MSGAPTTVTVTSSLKRQSRLVATALHVKAETAHRSGQNAALAETSGHCAFAMDPEITVSVAFERHMVVIGGDDGLPAESGTQDRVDDSADFRGK